MDPWRRGHNRALRLKSAAGYGPETLIEVVAPEGAEQVIEEQDEEGGAEIEAARAALREGLERAKALVSEARQKIGEPPPEPEPEAEPVPPNPAT